MTAADVEASAGFSARLELAVGGAQAAARDAAAARRMLERPPAQPVFSRRVGEGTAVTATDLVIALGGPPQGFMWYVLQLIAGGMNWATSAAGTALLVVASSRPTNAASVGLANVYDEAASLPLPAGYSRGQVVAKYPDHLYVIVQGGTNGQLYVAACQIEQYEDAARLQVAAQ